MSQSRRDFLKMSLGASVLLSLGPAVPGFLTRAAKAEGHAEGDTVLVMVQLAGGNDGLNTLIPYGYDEYGRSRSTLRFGANEVHKLDDKLGFHPQMKAFMKLYDEGQLSVVQGVGFPNSSRDHADAMQSWYTGKPQDTACQTGWLGRAVDTVCRADGGDVPGAFVGQIETPLALNAEKAVVPAIRSLDDYVLGAPSDAKAEGSRRRKGDGNPLLGFVREAAREARECSRRVEAAAEAHGAAGDGGYPHYKFAQSLRTVAQLIRADLGIRIYLTELGGAGFGGFDNHANQRGNHGALLRQLAESVAAFVADLKRDRLLGRVLLTTFSEFGRTLAENGRRGTGHGAAAPMFLAGGKLKGGLVGAHPSLTDLNQGAPKFHTDFRRVYATALDSWLGIDSQAVLGRRFEPLDVLQA